MISQVIPENIAVVGSGETQGAIVEATYSQPKRFERWGVITCLSGFAMLLLTVASIRVRLPFNDALGYNLEVFGFITPWVLATAFLLLIGGLGLALYPRLVKILSKLSGV